MPKTLSPALVWFRRDLRLTDNPALTAAVQSGRPILALYVHDEASGGRPLGGAARWWLDRSLRALDSDLRERGSRLILRRGDAALQVLSLVKSVDAGLVVWNRLYDPDAVERDAALKQALTEDGVQARSFNGSLLVEPWSVTTGTGQPFKVFTPFWRAARAKIAPFELAPAPGAMTPLQSWPQSDDLDAWRLSPTTPDWSSGFVDWRPGEAGAADALRAFLGRSLAGYGVARDRPGEAATSRLAPHLHWGEIGPRQVWRSAHDHVDALGAVGPREDLDKFLSELGWRDFNHQLLFHNPRLPSDNFRREFDRFPWREDLVGLRAWRRGRTGYPIVDAGLRELWVTGFMHNRVRMVVASFLIKHLLIDWRLGEAWFWDTLLDADLANNAANWQWVAGCGADAAPFFRIFNPIAQGEKFDPQGVYVRRWLPELSRLPDAVLHAPWTADPQTLRLAGVALGSTYPHPIVEHGFARQRALDALKAVKSAGSEGE